MYSYSQENRLQISVPDIEEVFYLNDNLVTKTESNVTQQMNVISVYIMGYPNILTFLNVLLLMF